jgi:hypothetical protein
VQYPSSGSAAPSDSSNSAYSRMTSLRRRPGARLNHPLTVSGGVVEPYAEQMPAKEPDVPKRRRSRADRRAHQIQALRISVETDEHGALHLSLPCATDGPWRVDPKSIHSVIFPADLGYATSRAPTDRRLARLPRVAPTSIEGTIWVLLTSAERPPFGGPPYDVVPSFMAYRSALGVLNETQVQTRRDAWEALGECVGWTDADSGQIAEQARELGLGNQRVMRRWSIATVASLAASSIEPISPIALCGFAISLLVVGFHLAEHPRLWLDRRRLSRLIAATTPQPSPN